MSNPSLANETIVGKRSRSGALSLASTSGVELIRFANWSWLMSQVTFGYCLVNSSESLKGMSNPVSKDALSTTGSVPQLGPAAAAGSVGASVAAGGSVITSVAGAFVAAGAAVVAGVPQAERSMDVKTSRLTRDHNTDFLFISLSPYIHLRMDSILGWGF